MKKESKSEDKKEKVSVKIKGVQMSDPSPVMDRDPVVHIEKAKNGFIISANSMGGKDHKEYTKNLLGTPSILRRIFNTGNKSYTQIKEMMAKDDGDGDEGESA